MIILQIFILKRRPFFFSFYFRDISLNTLIKYVISSMVYWTRPIIIANISNKNVQLIATTSQTVVREA